jgi:hypothetical protein
LGNSRESICKRFVRKEETVSSTENLSRAAKTRGPEDTSRYKVKEFGSCCLTLDESNDTSDTAQLLSLFEVYNPFDRSRTI